MPPRGEALQQFESGIGHMVARLRCEPAVVGKTCGPARLVTVSMSNIDEAAVATRRQSIDRLQIGGRRGNRSRHHTAAARSWNASSDAST